MSRRAFPPAYPTVAEVVSHAPGLARSLRRRGVPEADVEDVLQKVLMAAITAIAKGNFRLDPADPPRTMLRVYLLAIARQQALTFINSARYRHEALIDTTEMMGKVTAFQTDALAARSALAQLAKLAPEERALLTDLANGMTVKEIAARDGVNQSTLWGRITRARAKFLDLIEHQRRW